MTLTVTLLTAFVLIGLGLTVGLMSVLEALFQAPPVRVGRVDSRRQAAEALVRDSDAFLVHSEILRNVSQSA